MTTPLKEAIGRRLAARLVPNAAVAFLVVLLVALPLAAQTPASTNPQMRHFWHVFAAYALAWTLVFGWVVSIVRRLKKIEEKLGS
jgi:CcmD family protein